MSKRFTQVDYIQARLEKGYIETGQSLREAGILNFHARIAELRQRYVDNGKPWDYVKTYMKPVMNKHFGAKTEIALYYIPERCSKLNMWCNGIKINKTKKK